MKDSRELTALPSRVTLQEGETAVLGELSEEERKKIYHLMYRNMEKSLSDYYSANPSEREKLTEAVSV